MTDIVERLQEQSLMKQGEAWRRQDGGQDLSIGAQLAEDAIAEIERLRQRADDYRADALRLHADKMRFFEALLDITLLNGKNDLPDAWRIARAALNIQQRTGD